MKKGISRCLLLVMFFTSSCRHELKSPAYIKYVQDEKNGLRKNITVDKWEFIFQYKPTDYIIFLENKGKNNSQDKRRKNLNGTAWFNISFRLLDGNISPLRYNLSTRSEYDIRFDYFLNKAVNDIRLVYDNKDTLRPMSYLFENNFNLTPQETLVVGFALPPGQEELQDMQLSYSDVVFRNGIIKAKFKREDLNKIPKLSF